MTRLRLVEMTRTFGGLTAVDRVSFSVEGGERLAIIGPNGAGKTTLLNLLSGELEPTSGQVFLDGRDITALSAYERARLHLGRTFQQNNLFMELSVFENVRLAVQQREGIASRLVRGRRYSTVVEATREILARRDLEEFSDQPVSSLPYGAQRQLEVTLALATRAEILLLDEPTTGMAPSETRSMIEMLEGLSRDFTLLIIEHDMDVVFSLADRVVVLHFGQVIADGTPEDVRTDPRVQEVYLGVGE